MAKKGSQGKKKTIKEVVKSEILGYPGGTDVDLSTKVDGVKVGEKLRLHLSAVLAQEIENQKGRIAKLPEWDKQYRGIKDPKNFPYEKAANTSVPLSRYCVDTTLVRMMDVLQGGKKLVMAQAQEEEFVDFARDLEDGFNWVLKEKINLFEKLHSPMLQGLKTGRGIIKIDHVQEKRLFYRYATKAEQNSNRVKKYKAKGTRTPLVKDVVTEYSGPTVYGIPREDWVQSVNSTCIDDAYICGFKKEYRLEELKTGIKKGLYYKDAVEKLTQPDKHDEVKEGRVESTQKEYRVPEGTKRFDVWEIWMNYDVDNDGEPDSIVITFHLETNTILRCIYNPIFYGFRPFESLVYYPSEYDPEGEGICEILERPQKEIDQLHNHRLDRLAQINAPMLFVRAGSGLEKWKMSPGTVTVVNDELETAIKEVAFHDVYPSTFAEEDRLIQYAREAVGVSAAAMGQETAERPVFRETMALLAETNKKFKYGDANYRRGLNNGIKKMVDIWAQYEPIYKYKTNEGGKFEEKKITFPAAYMRDAVKIQIAVSSEIENQQVRREINLTLYQLVSDYHTKVAGMIQAIVSPVVHPDFKKYLIRSIEIGNTLLERIVEDFDEPEGKALLIDLEKTIDVDGALKMQPPEQQPPGAGGEGGGQPPQGQPPMSPVGGMPGV